MSEIEKSIIGSLLIDDHAITKVLFLTPEMFTDSLYSAVFYKIRSAFDTGKKVDVTTLSADLGGEQLSAPFIARSLGECVADTVTSANVAEYAKRLHADYKKREAGKILEALSNADNVDDALSESIGKMAKLLAGTAEDGATVAEMVSKYQKQYFREKEREYLYFGIESIDGTVGGLDPKDVTVIAARPGVGKSALALQIARNMARSGKRVGYFNLEMNACQIYERIVAAESGVSTQRIRHDTSAKADDFKMFMEANERLGKERNLTVFDNARTVARFRAELLKTKYDVLIVDYLQLIIPGKDRGANRTAEVGDISRDLKNLASDFGIHIIALSQLNRASEARAGKEPTMADIRESGAIEQDASNILIMWEPDDGDDSKRKLKVEKARNGSRGQIDLTFDGPHMRFKEVDWQDADENPFT